MTGREGNEKSKFHFTEAIVRWQLLRCWTVEDEHHCLAGARGHGPPDRQLLLLPSRYPESSHSLPAFCSVCRVYRGCRDTGVEQRNCTNLAGAAGVLEIMSLYAAFMCNVHMLQNTVQQGLSIKMMHYGWKKLWKNVWQKIPPLNPECYHLPSNALATPHLSPVQTTWF